MTSAAYDNVAKKTTSYKKVVTSQTISSAKKSSSPLKSTYVKSTRLASPMKMNQNQLVSNIQFVAHSAQIAENFTRSRSPAKQVFMNDINRAIARELYVDSTVNVVNNSSNKSPGKIKPG